MADYLAKRLARPTLLVWNVNTRACHLDERQDLKAIRSGDALSPPQIHLRP